MGKSSAFRVTIASVALITLSGCAWSAEGLSRSAVESTIRSAKTSESFATCVSEKLVGNNPLRHEGDHWWVLRLNGYGIPLIRWDFFPEPGGGSRAELRSSLNLAYSAHDKVRACA